MRLAEEARIAAEAQAAAQAEAAAEAAAAAAAAEAAAAEVAADPFATQMEIEPEAMEVEPAAEKAPVFEDKENLANIMHKLTETNKMMMQEPSAAPFQETAPMDFA